MASEKIFNHCSASSHAAGLLMDFFGKRAVNKKENLGARETCIMRISLALKGFFDEINNTNRVVIQEKTERSEQATQETPDELPF